MESIDRLATISLTKDNRQKILDINDGFKAESYYNSKRDGSYIREYKISNGKLVIRDMLRNATNENQDDKSWIATDAEVHRFLLRYYCTSKFEWNSNEFQTSFNLSHNVWVQYIKSKNSVVVFDDRASNARIKISPEIHISVDTSEDKDGYFVSRVTNAYKNGSMATKIARLIIGYVPYLKDVDKIYTTLSDKKYTENNNRKWFEKNYTKEVRAQIKDLKYAPNNKGYAQDYIGITISAKNVNAIKYGNSWTCSTT